MNSDCNDNPDVLIVKGNKGLVVYNDEFAEDWWFVYSGNKDLTGFICDEQRERAKEILKSFEGE